MSLNHPGFLGRHDRKLAVSFGALVLLLMLTASGAAGYLFTQLNHKEENRLSSTIATILAQSIAEVSFSGKHHARLFVEEMQAQVPELSFISMETREGQILAHSQSEKNDASMQGEEETALRNLSLERDAMIAADHVHNGQVVKEVVLPYRSGQNKEAPGVVRIGIKMEEVRKAQQTTFFKIIILIAALAVAAIGGILFLSQYFGGEYRILAAQLKGIMAHTPLPISITNQAGQLLACSGQCERLFGCPVNRPTLDRYLEGHLAPADIRKLIEINNVVFTGGRSAEQEIEVECHGQPCVWHVSKFPIAYNDHGGPTHICTFIHDITERKTAEKRAIEAKEQWERTFNAIDDIVTIHDLDMRIIRANKAAADLFQVSPDELTGSHCYKLFRGATEPCDDCPEILSRQDLTSNRTTVYHHKLGKTFEAASFPFIDESGLSGFVHIAKDITQALRLEEQLKQAQKMEAIGTLAGGIAHDFNNILTPIFGFTEMTLIKIAPDTSMAQNLRQIKVAAGRAKDLVQQILAFSRQGKQEKKPLQPHLVVKEALKLLRASLPATIEFKTEIAADCGAILADPTQFHQIVMNLCTNAYHAMEATGGVLGVQLSRVSIDEKDNKVAGSELLPGDYILLTVSDTGYGMERKTMERIFEPYFTTKPDGKGTGLGLSMVHGIVKSCQGQISVYSEPGKGTSFHVYLPRIIEQAAMGGSAPDSPLPTGNGQVLVVDDEASITTMIQSFLKDLGYQTTVANSSLDALDLIEQNPDFYDLLITDMTMPHLTGLELARKTLAIRSNLPIILCTGFSELINEEHARAIGVRSYLTKPLSVGELALTVHRILTGKEDK